jgi:hypothetical protein
MRYLIAVSVAVLTAACGGQTISDPCLRKLNVEDVADVTRGGTAVVHATITDQTGNCTTADAALSWSSSRPTIGDIVSSDNSSATVRALAVGHTTITAWFTHSPTTRDSTSVGVVAPTDQ